jgi:2-polyprenyl-6-hydroxyphenyl methylase/3-demethylubiquinone-9 3-methyltransferase
MSGSAVSQSPQETRFAFGENWQGFLRHIDEQRISEAKKSLLEKLRIENLEGKSFLDIGCGSGLFSLAALLLGARKVYSFDYDRDSVACAQELKHRHSAADNRWTIEQGSALDQSYLATLGVYDVVYSWGVLHHTGNMWDALHNVVSLVAPGGWLYIALYNDQGIKSEIWKKLKILYNHYWLCRMLMIPAFICSYAFLAAVKDLVSIRNPLTRYKRYRNLRGMAFVPDVLDWLGGYPFEVAKPQVVIDFFKGQGFELVNIRTVGSKAGNNEFVFRSCVD